MYHPVLWAAFGTGITCLSTVLGSATVLFVRGKTTPTLQRMFLGFADQHRPSLSVWRSFRSGRTYFRHFSGFGRGNHHPLYALAALLRRRHHDVCSHRGAHPGGAFGRALQYRHDERDVWLCRNDDLRHRTGIEKLIILICQRPSIYFRQMGGRLCFLG